MSPYDAFVMALVLALKPRQTGRPMAAEIAEDLAKQLTSLQVDQGKKEALGRV